MLGDLGWWLLGAGAGVAGSSLIWLRRERRYLADWWARLDRLQAQGEWLEAEGRVLQYRVDRAIGGEHDR